MDKEKELELLNLAKKARKNSYIPYSHFGVGAAALFDSGKIYTGCNIENIAYGSTNCAERTAIFKAVSEGERKLLAIAIVGGPENGELLTFDYNIEIKNNFDRRLQEISNECCFRQLDEFNAKHGR